MGNCTSKQPAEPIANTKGSNVNGQIKRREQNQVSNSSNNESSSSNNSKQQSDDSAATKSNPQGSNNNLAASNNSGSNAALIKEVKVLLLGSGESGKSTIVKQMKILHNNGYTKEEIYEYKPFVYKNVLDCIKNVLNAIIDLEPDLIESEGSTHSPMSGKEDVVEGYHGTDTMRKHILAYDDINDVLDYDISMDAEDELFDPRIAKIIGSIYSLPEVQHFIKYQQGNFYYIDSSDYFLSDVNRIASPNYFPTVNDILRTRKKTSGIFDFKFSMKGLNIHMFDVGGQRSERRKWIHCFDNVSIIIFCVALSEYDQVLLEESNQNRMEESLTLFDSVVNSRWFSRTSIVLFLNKIDVFSKKLPYSPLENHFPDYTGGENVNKAAKYILWRFTQVNRSDLSIYPHVTQATDTSNIQLVFAAIRESILENALKDTGIL